LSVLIVDDEALFRDELRERLLEFHPSYRVEVAADGSEALEKARAADPPFDVAVIDDILAGPESGVSVMRRLRTMSPEMEFVVLTGQGLEAMKAGAYRYLREPFDVEELVLTINHAYEYRQLKEAVQEKQGATAVENAQFYEAAEQRAEQMRRLLEVSEALARQTDLWTALHLIADAVQTMDYQMVAVCLRDQEDKVRLLASAGLTKDEKAKLGEVIGSWEEFSAPMQERFRISCSYFVPEGEYTWDDYKASGIVRDLGARLPGEWRAEDLLRVPLVGATGQVLGVISVSDPSDRRRPDLGTVQALELFANHAAAAIERVNPYRRLQHVVASTKAISEGITRSPKEVYEQIARRACEVVGADSAIIYPYEVETLRFDVEGWTGYGLLEPRWPLKIKQRVGTGMAASILKEGEVIVEDTSSPTEEGRGPLSWESEFIKREKVTAFVGLRLQVGERPVGILYINLRNHPHHFTEEELAAIRPFADHAALSIRIAQLYEQKRRALEGIAQADQEIVSTLELEEVLRRVVEQAHATLNATSAILFPYDARMEVLRRPIFSGFLKQPNLCDKPTEPRTALARLRASNEPQFADDSNEHPVMAGEFVRREGIASSAGLPLKAADQIMGYLFVNYTEPHHFTDDEKQFFITLANQAALAIRSARAYEELEFHATVAGMAAWGAELAHDINREVYQIRSRADWALRFEGLPDEVQTWLREIDQRAETLSIVPIPAQSVGHALEQLAVPLDEALRKWATHYAVCRPDVQACWEMRCGRARAAISDWWLGRVMRHLVRNALEAMPEGGTLTIRSRVQENDCAEVQIEDMGTGVGADVLPDLFRVPTSSRGEGRGFGLIIARFAIERYGGEIWLQRTDQGKGTTFAFTLPLVAETLV
jgi:GAF domain-containing protein/ActR/RegA family two-component response regulator